MKYEEPATGILKTNDFGDCIFYTVNCDCGNDVCSHNISVEADDTGVTVMNYMTYQTRFWDLSRWKQIWEILTTGKTEFQSTIVLKEQAAYNYAEALRRASEDTVKIRQERFGSKKTNDKETDS